MKDPIKENAIINGFEINSGKVILSSTPQYITIGAHHKCNADCIFCLGGDFPDFTLEIYKNLFEKKLSHILRRVNHVGFCGFGEILLMPGIEQFLEYINITLPHAAKVFTTNGIPLTNRINECLTSGWFSLVISLHASNKLLHEKMTRTKSFDRIKSNIQNLIQAHKKKHSKLDINLVFIATKVNIENLPDFVVFAKELGANRVTCNYLTIYETQQVDLSCFFCQEKTIEAFNKAQEIAVKIGIPISLPPKFGEHKHNTEQIRCLDPWNFFYVETQGSVNPCCSAGEHIGYLDKDNFNEIWNGPGYKNMRESLLSGKTHLWCKHCYKYDPDNVNDIRSHVTFRPDTQKMILSWIKDHKNGPSKA